MKECYGKCNRCCWSRVVGGCIPNGLDDEDERDESGLLEEDE